MYSLSFAVDIEKKWLCIVVMTNLLPMHIFNINFAISLIFGAKYVQLNLELFTELFWK